MRNTGTDILYRRSNGQSLSVRGDSRIGSGGEGVIYALHELPDLVAKVYHTPDEDIGAKLALMVDNPPEMPAGRGHISVAWPLDTLHSALPASQENTVGYLMHRISAMEPVNQCYSPLARRRKFSHFTYRHLCFVAMNIAVAVGAIHDHNYVIGDLNETNILVNDNGLVTLIDTDSFQVIDRRDGTIFRSPVGKPEFTPVELQGHNFDAVNRDQLHDRFGLGVLTYQLLMEGRHPFTGRYLGEGEPPAIEDSIARGFFLHSEKRAVPFVDGPGFMPWPSLDGSVRDLFRLCFETGHDTRIVRPTPYMWEGRITQAARSLETCRQNPQHMYFRHNRSCPWCERRNLLGGKDPFPGSPGPEPFLMRSPTTQPAPDVKRQKPSRPQSRSTTSRRQSTVSQPRAPTSAHKLSTRTRIRWRFLVPSAGAAIVLVAAAVIALGIYQGWWILPWEDQPIEISVETGPFVSVSAGLQHTCRVKRDLTVVCWGDNEYSQSSAPQGAFTLVSAGQSHSCGVGADGIVLCWGNQYYGQSSPPDGAFSTVSAGLTHSCGVRTDGVVECWGGDEAGKSTPPAGVFSSVSAGWYHSCGVDTSQTIVCWGDDAYGQSSPPIGTFTSVSVGQRHSCGVGADGSIACWGSNDNGQASSPYGTFVSVSAGALHSCGVRTDRSVDCWGNDHYGQARPPARRFLSVSAGFSHSCGVRADGSVECWGNNERGQSAPSLQQSTAFMPLDHEDPGRESLLPTFLTTQSRSLLTRERKTGRDFLNEGIVEDRAV